MDGPGTLYFSSNEVHGVRFENTSVAIFGAANPAGGAQIQDNLFEGCDQSGATEYFSATFTSAFQCDFFSNNTFIRAESLLAQAGTNSVVSATTNIDANKVQCKGNFPSWLSATYIDNKNRDSWTFEDGAGRLFKPVKADADVAAGDLVMAFSTHGAKKFDSTQGSAVCGVAFNAAAANAYYFRQLRGPCDRVNLVSGATPDGTRTLIPTSTLGKANATASGLTATAPVIGRATSGNNAGNLTSAATTNGSPNITMAANTNVRVGDAISGTGIPAGTTVITVTSSTALVLSANASATNTGLTLTFGDYCTAELRL
jgi:hypothetical protein